MPRGFVALVIELHHPLPGPGRSVGSDWAVAAVETYWPVLRAVSTAADAGLAEVLTLAVSPSWTALAADPEAQALIRAELDERVERAEHAAEARAWAEHWHALRQFVVDRWGSDPLGPLRRALDAGAIELIPTAASPAWLPSVVERPVLARAQVGLAVADHAQRFGVAAQGLWLPNLAYRPDLEKVLARFGVRYFAVDAEAFVRGTVRPPSDQFGPLITPPGVAAFGIDPEPTRLVTDPGRRYALDPRYGEPTLAGAAVTEHANHFTTTWRQRVEAEAEHGLTPTPPLSVAALSAYDLGGWWIRGADWLEQVVLRLAEPSPIAVTTPGRHLDRFPEGPIGRPGPSAGGILSVRPADSDLLDRIHLAADALAEAVAHRETLGPLGRRAVAQMARALLAAQALDWHLPPGLGLGPQEGLARAEENLAQVAELAGLLAAGRLDPSRLAELEMGVAYLPDIDPDHLAES